MGGSCHGTGKVPRRRGIPQQPPSTLGLVFPDLGQTVFVGDNLEAVVSAASADPGAGMGCRRCEVHVLHRQTVMGDLGNGRIRPICEAIMSSDVQPPWGMLRFRILVSMGVVMCEPITLSSVMFGANHDHCLRTIPTMSFFIFSHSRSLKKR